MCIWIHTHRQWESCTESVVKWCTISVKGTWKRLRVEVLLSVYGNGTTLASLVQRQRDFDT